MPSEWSAKRERQYEHIKESERERGRSSGTAKRIAAATVNKTRRAKGEAKSTKKATAKKSTGRTRAKQA